MVTNNENKTPQHQIYNVICKKRYDRKRTLKEEKTLYMSLSKRRDFRRRLGHIDPSHQRCGSNQRTQSTLVRHQNSISLLSSNNAVFVENIDFSRSLTIESIFPPCKPTSRAELHFYSSIKLKFKQSTKLVDDDKPQKLKRRTSATSWTVAVVGASRSARERVRVPAVLVVPTVVSVLIVEAWRTVWFLSNYEAIR